MFRKILACLLVITVLSGCSGQNPLAVFFKKKKERVRIGLSIPTTREARWQRDLQYLKEAASTADAELYTEISENNSAVQENQCDALLKKNINVLILAPHDARAAASIVDKAAAMGVKVISYDRLVLGADVDLYVSFNNIKVGELQAGYILRKAPRGNYMVLSGALTDNNAKLFHDGALKILGPAEESGMIKIVADVPVEDWDSDVAEKITEEVLNRYNNDIHAVIAPNDSTAGGVIMALKKHHIAGLVPVSGQDADVEAVHRIMRGMQTMTVFKDSHNLATAAIGAAMSMAVGEPPPSNSVMYNGKGQIPSMLLEPVVVDNSNIVQTLVQTGYLSREQVYYDDSVNSNSRGRGMTIKNVPGNTAGGDY